MAESIDWDPVRELARRVEAGEALSLTAEVRALLLRSAREVGIPEEDAHAAVAGVATATALLHETRRRIRDGSRARYWKTCSRWSRCPSIASRPSWPWKTWSELPVTFGQALSRAEGADSSRAPCLASKPVNKASWVGPLRRAQAAAALPP